MIRSVLSYLVALISLAVPIRVISQVLPTYLDAYTYNPSRPTELVFSENFNTNNNKWNIGTQKNSNSQFGSNRLRFVSKAVNGDNSWRFLTNSIMPLDLSNDYVIKTNMEIIGGGYASAYYVIWGEDLNNRYCFGFKVADHSYNYDVCQNGVWSQVFAKEGFKSSFPSYNYIEISKKGDSISFYVNQKLIATTLYKSINRHTPGPGQPLHNMIGYTLFGEAVIQSNGLQVFQNKRNLPALDSAYFLSYAARFVTGDIPATYQLANMYWLGAGTASNKTKALQLYEMGAEKNDILCMANTAFIYKKSFAMSGYSGDKDKAVSWYKKLVSLSKDWRYWSDYMDLMYPYVAIGERGHYTIDQLPPSKEEYLSAKAAQEKIWAKINADAQLKNRPLMALLRVSIDHTNRANCYVADGRIAIPFREVNAAGLKVNDYYFDEPSKELLLYSDESSLTDWAKKQVFLNAFSSPYRVELTYSDTKCHACDGKGSIKGGYGTYNVSVPNGTYSTSRSQSIVGQTEIVSRIPNYSTVSVNAYIPPQLCKGCDGSGKRPKECLTDIRIKRY